MLKIASTLLRTASTVVGLSLMAPAAALAAWPSDSTTNLPVCMANYRQENVAIASDGLGGAFIAWDDWRASIFDARVYVQHITASGAIASGWPANGAPACTTTVNQYQPAIVGDGSGGAIVSWADARGGGNVFAQRLDGLGNRLWDAGGETLSVGSKNIDGPPTMLPDGAGGAFVTWTDFRSGFNRDVYAQHVAGDGSRLWGAGGLPVGVTPELQSLPQLVSDKVGGVIVAWSDQRNGPGDIYAQRLTSDGSALWTANGIPVCNDPSGQGYAALAPDGAGGAFVGWWDVRTSPQGEAYAHHLTSAGVDPTWTPNGIPLVTLPSAFQSPPLIVSDGDSGAIYVWHDYRGTSGAYGQRLDRHGMPQWAANGVSLTQQNWFPTVAVSDSGGGAIIAMESVADIRAQRIRPTGTVQWGPDGVAVSTEQHNQNFVAAVADGAHGAILAWHDTRSDTGDVYAQNVNANGSLGGDIVAAQLALVSADARPGVVALQWLSPDRATTLATLYRTSDEIGWTELAALTADGTGMLAYEDHSVAAGARYGYRLGVSTGGREEFTSIAWVEVPAEFALALEAPRPNPASRQIQFLLTLPRDAPARVGIYDPAGRLVRELVHEQLDAGDHTIHWGADGHDGRPVAEGIYFVRAEVAGEILSRRVALIR